MVRSLGWVESILRRAVCDFAICSMMATQSPTWVAKHKLAMATKCRRKRALAAVMAKFQCRPLLRRMTHHIPSPSPRLDVEISDTESSLSSTLSLGGRWRPPRAKRGVPAPLYVGYEHYYHK